MKRQTTPLVVHYVAVPTSEQEIAAIYDEIYAFLLDPSDEEWAQMMAATRGHGASDEAAASPSTSIVASEKG